MSKKPYMEKNTPFIREVVSQQKFLQRNYLPSVKKPYMEFAEKKTPLLYRNLLALKWQKLRTPLAALVLRA